MSARSLASLSLSFGMVSIPIKVYSATESSAAIRFKLMSASGLRVKQQYVADVAPPPQDERPSMSEPAREQERAIASARPAASKVIDFPSVSRTPPLPSPLPAPGEAAIERSAMLKGYEFEKGKFVLFTTQELKALEAGARKTIDIVSFIPENAVDPIYYDKAYFLAPDKRGAKPYSLLLRAMRDMGRCALARWAFRSKEYVVQIRAAEGGMVLQQMLYAEEVRSLADLHIELSDVGDAELDLAKQLIRHISADAYDPAEFIDEEKQRILAAVERKIAGQPAAAERIWAKGGQVVDLLEALRASLGAQQGVNGAGKSSGLVVAERKPAKRAPAKPAKSAKSAKPAKMPALSARTRSGKH